MCSATTKNPENSERNAPGERRTRAPSLTAATIQTATFRNHFPRQRYGPSPYHGGRFRRFATCFQLIQTARTITSREKSAGAIPWAKPESRTANCSPEFPPGFDGFPVHTMNAAPPQLGADPSQMRKKATNAILRIRPADAESGPARQSNRDFAVNHLTLVVSLTDTRVETMLSVFDLKLPAVPGAGHHPAAQHALTQRTAGMRTNTVQHMKPTVHIENSEHSAVRDHLRRFPDWHLIDLNQRNQLTHESYFPSSPGTVTKGPA